MDDLSSASIHEDVIIFSTQKVNAWKATVKSGSIIVMGGNRETLQDILRHRIELASKLRGLDSKAQNLPSANTEAKCGHISPSELVVSTPRTPLVSDDFEIITGDEAKKTAKSYASVSIANDVFDLSNIIVPGDVHVQYDNAGKISSLIFRRLRPTYQPDIVLNSVVE